jgi:glycosyltransferase involved in cell wall biosynthesis
MLPNIILLRPKQKKESRKNGQNQRVETLHESLLEFGFPVQIVEVTRFPMPREYRSVLNLVATSDSVLAITSFILLPWCLSPLGKKKIKIIDMMDSLTKTRKYDRGGIFRWILGKFESLVSISFRSNHIRTYISKYDRDSDREIIPQGIQTFVIPNSMALNNAGISSNLKRLVFVGDLNYLENRNMLSDLSIVLNAVEMDLHIYGAGQVLMKTNSKNIKFHGECDDEELYQSGDLHLAPVRNMHGISSKVFHALARGVPVLTTEFGINGIKESAGLFVESDIRLWPVLINEIFLASQKSSFKVNWNGFECDEHELLRFALLDLLTE